MEPFKPAVIYTLFLMFGTAITQIEVGDGYSNSEKNNSTLLDSAEIQILNPWVKIPEDWNSGSYSDESSTSSESSYSMSSAQAQYYSSSYGGSDTGTEPFFDHAMMTNLSEHLGNHAFLRCRVKKLGDGTVSWIRRRDWHILTSGRHVYTNDDRFQIDHTGGSDEWTLLIKYVQTRDNGTYECQVSSAKGIISHLFNLNVLVPQAHILGAKEYHVQRGTVISLVCIIENFKKVILPQIPSTSMVANLSRDDLYLMGWLRSKYLNIKEAEKMFLLNLKWREEEKMDTIHLEDWSVFTQDFPFFVDTYDKYGRPTAEAWIADWDVRAAVLTGHARKLSRLFNRFFEINMRRLYNARAEGKNVTRTVFLTDVEGFSFRHGCPICTQIYIRFGHVWENNYPDLLEGAVAINMTPAFQMVLDGLKPFIRAETRSMVRTYVLRRHWLPALDKQFEKSERSPRFGGTKVRK